MTLCKPTTTDDKEAGMNVIERFYTLAVSLFFCFIYFYFSADPNFGLKQTINLFFIFLLIAGFGIILIRKATRVKPGSPRDDANLTYLKLDLSSETKESEPEIQITNQQAINQSANVTEKDKSVNTRT